MTPSPAIRVQAAVAPVQRWWDMDAQERRTALQTAWKWLREQERRDAPWYRLQPSSWRLRRAWVPGYRKPQMVLEVTAKEVETWSDGSP